MAAFDQIDIGIGLEQIKERAKHPPLDRQRFGAAAEPFSMDLGPEALALRRPASARFRAAASVRATLLTSAPLFLADALSLALCAGFFALLLQLRYGAPLSAAAPILIFLPLLIFGYWFCGLYSAGGLNPVLEMRQLVQVNTIAFAAGAIGGLIPLRFLPWYAATWAFSLALLPLGRGLARRWCCRRSWWGHPALIIGSGPGADAVARALRRAPTCGLRPLAITDPLGDGHSALLPVINDPEELTTLLESEGIQYAVVSLPDLSTSRLFEVVEQYTDLLPRVLLLGEDGLPSLWVRHRTCGRLGAIEICNRRMLPLTAMVKRCMDLLVSLVALVLALPLLLVIAVLVKLTSHGSIFYGHNRIGQRGKSFKAWKFRTMYTNGDALLRAHFRQNSAAHEEWKLHHKLRQDPRVTPIGRLLRKSSLDEVPQIWNVLKGEMSLVGPRPIVTDEISKYGQIFKHYTAVKPGITGLWQVSGRNDVSYDERVRLDRYYIANWSPWLDIYIIAKTIFVLVQRNGAY